MSHWFETAFGEDYMRLYSHRDASEAAKAADLIISTTGVSAGARLLDAPCGAGRHLKAFHEHGLNPLGFDLSWPLLHEAIATPSTRGTVVRADLRSLPFKPGRFDLVVNLFSSLGYFDTDRDNISVLGELVLLLDHGGWLVVDFMNSDYVRKNLVKESHRVTTDALQVQEYRSIDGRPSRVNKKMILTYPDGTEKHFEESVRLFSPQELRAAFERFEVRVEKELGGYGGESFTAESDRIIIFGRRS